MIDYIGAAEEGVAMTAKTPQHSDDLEQQIIAFEQQNPKIAEAMKLFGMTMAEYQKSLYFLYGPRTYMSNTTDRLDQRQHGKLE